MLNNPIVNVFTKLDVREQVLVTTLGVAAFTIGYYGAPKVAKKIYSMKPQFGKKTITQDTFETIIVTESK